jgi:hypothetical protein
MVMPFNFCRFHSITGEIHLQDNTVMDQAVNGGGRGHGVLKDGFPFGKGQIGGDHNAAAFVAVVQESEENFHFLPALLDISEVIDNNRIKTPEIF